MNELGKPYLKKKKRTQRVSMYRSSTNSNKTDIDLGVFSTILSFIGQ